ncbi:MAG: ATP-dependent helicase [Lachnospiraceae bacterium]|nr:ATP-dependent helicase [Lachnospiraceae bacterium]
MIKGPVLCLAGPGSGKTFTLVCRLRFLIEKHFVPPDSILVITYSKAAALSMQQRFNREMNGKSLPVVFGTFHALCFHILKQQYSFKLDSLLSYPERIQTIQSILQSMYIQSPDEEMCDAILGCISLYKNGKYSEELSLPMNMDREGFTRIYEEYCRRNWQKGKLDFDDMLFLCLELLQKKPTVLSYWQKRFSYILVDEFQDCNRIQYEIVKKLAASDENLFVVGDDDQSIYGFRGASPDILQLFLCDFPNAGQILLGGNYRSRPEIIEAAGRVIIQNEKRMNKTLYAAGGVELLAGREPVQIKCFEGYRMQSAYLTEQLKLLHTQIPWEEMAVIFRTNREMEMLFPFLQKEKIPCCIRGGMKNPYAHFVVQDILAYLRFASGEHSRKIFLQIMTKPERGISRELLWEEKVNFVKLEEELVLHHKREEAKAVRRLSSQFEKLNKMSPYLAIQFIRNAMGYERWLRGRAGEEVSAYEEWKERLDELQQSARNFTQIGEWLSFIEQKEKEVENIERGSVKEIQRGVNLLTFHGSKGLEFTYVCLPNLNEGKLPHGRMPDQAAVEEERRLFYVGMTRAKKALELLYLTGTKERPRQPSRFLQPLIMTDNYSFSSESNSSNS